MQLSKSLFLFRGDWEYNQNKSYHLMHVDYVLGTEFIQSINYNLLYSPQ